MTAEERAANHEAVLAAMPEPQTRAMQALFDFAEAMEEGGLSIGDLRDVMRLAIADGLGTFTIILAMASCAVQMLAEEREKGEKK